MGLYLIAFGLTLAVEVPIYTSCLVLLLRVPGLHAAGAAVAVNAVTHPIAFLLISPSLQPRLGGLLPLTVVEPAAWLAETAMLYAWLRRGRLMLLVISFVANGASLAAGLLVLFR